MWRCWMWPDASLFNQFRYFSLQKSEFQFHSSKIVIKQASEMWVFIEAKHIAFAIIPAQLMVFNAQ